MADLSQIIMHLYPHAQPVRDWYLAEVRGTDGEPVVQIAHWDERAIGSPRPTEQELLAQADTVLLERAKRSKLDAINARSRALLTAGLEVYVGIKISTSEAAQRNLSDLYNAVRDELASLPQGISTLDDGELIIEDWQELLQIVGLWRDRKLGVLDAGRALRLAVLAAETVEAVEAITDDRE